MVGGDAVREASAMKVVDAKPRSPVWAHLKKLALLPVTIYKPEKFASCNICFEEALTVRSVRFLIKNDGGTTKLRRHLFAHHAHIMVAEEEQQASLIVSEESSQKTMMAFLCDTTMLDHLYNYLNQYARYQYAWI